MLAIPSNWRRRFKNNSPKDTSSSEVKWSEVTQSRPTLCDPMDCNLPGSSVHGIFQARVLEWVAISIFPTEGSNLALPHCRQMLYHLSHRGSSSGMVENLWLWKQTTTVRARKKWASTQYCTYLSISDIMLKINIYGRNKWVNKVKCWQLYCNLSNIRSQHIIHSNTSNIPRCRWLRILMFWLISP